MTKIALLVEFKAKLGKEPELMPSVWRVIRAASSLHCIAISQRLGSANGSVVIPLFD